MTKVETIERKHHPFSPSTLQAREACPKYQPRSGTNEAAERGTLQHKVTETREDDNALTDEEAAAAAECLDFYEQRKHLMSVDAAILRTQPIIELSEVYLPVDAEPITYRVGEKYLNNPTTTGGYIDKGLISHDRLNGEIFDWKFGKWEVESAENNLQGIAYFLGLLRAYPTLQKVRVWFKQPHIDRIDHHDFLASDKDKYLLRVRTVVARAIQAADKAEDFSTANPTTSGCMFCGLIGVCPKVAEIALKVGSKFAPLKIPADINPSMLRDKHQASLALKCAAVLGVWCAGIKTATSNAVLSGSMDLPEGYTISTRSDRVITDAQKFREIAEKYLTPQEYDSLRDELPPITKVEKSISDKAVRGTKSATLEEFNTQLKDAKALDREPAITFLRMANAKDGKKV